MKTCIRFFLLLSLVGISFSPVFADETTPPAATTSTEEKTGSGINVKVTEKIPGANCKADPKNKDRFICVVQPGF
jgi:hypothetical protein